MHFDKSSSAIAVERIEGASSYVLTCEHASAALPSGWSWPDKDIHLETRHWGVDIGIARFTRLLAKRLDATAILAKASRLLVDCNRELSSPTLYRELADNAHVWLNMGISKRERCMREARVYEPYHSAISSACSQRQPALVLSMHSYTPNYEGQIRDVQVGVLHDGEPELASLWASVLQHELPGYDVRVNEPWSGLGGYMYSAVMHAEECGARAMELEIRNDLLVGSAVPELLAAIETVVRKTNGYLAAEEGAALLKQTTAH